MNPSSVEHMPGSQWKFDDDVTACFGDMLERSIPQYKAMRQAVYTLGLNFVYPGNSILDLGSSQGDALFPFVRKFGSQCNYLGVECSEPMLSSATARFNSLFTSDSYGNTEEPQVKFENLDLRKEYPDGLYDLTMSVLTLMFIPIEHRQYLIQRIYDHTNDNGAFIIVEKILGDTSRLDELFVDAYYSHKSDMGYSNESIQRKRMSLEGVLVPMTSEANITMLRKAGFRQIDCFWRWMNFCGWIALK